jgi:hypothetical protein
MSGVCSTCGETRSACRGLAGKREESDDLENLSVVWKISQNRFPRNGVRVEGEWRCGLDCSA